MLPKWSPFAAAFFFPLFLANLSEIPLSVVVFIEPLYERGEENRSRSQETHIWSLIFSMTRLGCGSSHIGVARIPKSIDHTVLGGFLAVLGA